MTHDSTDLRNVVEAIIAARQADERLSPVAIATEALAKLGPAELQLAAHHHLRQLARHACRKQFDEDDSESLDPDQQELFPGLQSRYPAARRDDDGPAYVLRDAMGPEDGAFNVKRLRSEGNTKLDRAKALEAWWEVKQESTAISPAA